MQFAPHQLSLSYLQGEERDFRNVFEQKLMDKETGCGLPSIGKKARLLIGEAYLF